MTRVPLNKEINTFVRGLITEANPLSFPENASIVDENFTLDTNGKRSRRLGLDVEAGNTSKNTGWLPSSSSTWAINTYSWTNVSNDGSIGILVVQIGAHLYFYDLYSAPLSSNPLNSGNRVYIVKADPTEYMSFTDINGKLVLTCGAKEIYILDYDKDTDVVTPFNGPIRIRDILGVDDGIGVTIKPSTLSAEHEYNLKNQGWTDARISDYFIDQNEYPSNNQIWTFGKDGTNNDSFDPTLLDRQDFGSTPAPKGRYIIRSFDRGISRQDQTGLSLPDDTSQGGLSCLAAYAGRVWFSGAGPEITDGDDLSPNLSNYVFFSQVVKSSENIRNCYQEADPTSEHISDLVDTDGGTVVLAGASRILAMAQVRNSLVVLAENGIWEIFGSDGTGFSATNIATNRISKVQIDSPRGYVAAEDIMFVWTVEGIYVITGDDVSGRLTAQSITENTIQSYYSSISAAGRRNARGVFDGITREVRWLYNDSDDYDGISWRSDFNKELILKTTLGAFHTFTFGDFASSRRLSEYVGVGNKVSTTVDQSVLDTVDTVVVGTSAVGVNLVTFERVETSIRYLSTFEQASTLRFDFCAYNNSNFEDFGEIDAEGVIITGYDSYTDEPKDTQRQKQIDNITFHFELTETGFTQDGNGDMQFDNPSSCLVSGRWDWANSEAGGGITEEQQAYYFNRNFIPSSGSPAFDWGFSLVNTQLKLPGSGRVLSIKFRTEPGKDLKLYGWGVEASANARASN